MSQNENGVSPDLARQKIREAGVPGRSADPDCEQPAQSEPNASEPLRQLAEQLEQATGWLVDRQQHMAEVAPEERTLLARLSRAAARARQQTGELLKREDGEEE